MTPHTLNGFASDNVATSSGGDTQVNESAHKVEAEPRAPAGRGLPSYRYGSHTDDDVGVMEQTNRTLPDPAAPLPPNAPRSKPLGRGPRLRPQLQCLGRADIAAMPRLGRHFHNWKMAARRPRILDRARSTVIWPRWKMQFEGKSEPFGRGRGSVKANRPALGGAGRR